MRFALVQSSTQSEAAEGRAERDSDGDVSIRYGQSALRLTLAYELVFATGRYGWREVHGYDVRYSLLIPTR